MVMFGCLSFPGLNVTTGGGVYEFSPTGTCLAEVSSSPTGTCITNVTSPLIIGPFGLALGPDGNVYVADFTGNSVEEINLSDGDLVTSFYYQSIRLHVVYAAVQIVFPIQSIYRRFRIFFRLPFLNQEAWYCYSLRWWP